MIFLFGSDREGNSYTITDLETEIGLAFAPEIIGTVVFFIAAAIINLLTGIGVISILSCCIILAFAFFWILAVKPKMKTIIFFCLLYFFLSFILQGIDCEISYKIIPHSGYDTTVMLGLYNYFDYRVVRGIIVLCSIAVVLLFVPMIIDLKSTYNIIFLGVSALLALALFIMFINLRASIKPAGKTIMFFILKSLLLFVISSGLCITALITRNNKKIELV